jgi:hypothetical protein
LFDLQFVKDNSDAGLGYQNNLQQLELASVSLDATSVPWKSDVFKHLLSGRIYKLVPGGQLCPINYLIIPKADHFDSDEPKTSHSKSSIGIVLGKLYGNGIVFYRQRFDHCLPPTDPR